ncbi:unnamed protein product [Adineta ricciae]|uniref:Uncharacterized protein n=1 Tax=Adineta ricciae TaxID=249248 RepID=A0A816AD87_ADIRI|nr:unnamed protein product [Adineta ricciae]
MVLEVRYGTSDCFVKGEMVRKVCDVRKGSVSLIRNPTWFRKSVSKPLGALWNYGRFCARHTKPKKAQYTRCWTFQWFGNNSTKPFWSSKPLKSSLFTLRNHFGGVKLKIVWWAITKPEWLGGLPFLLSVVG